MCIFLYLPVLAIKSMFQTALCVQCSNLMAEYFSKQWCFLLVLHKYYQVSEIKDDSCSTDIDKNFARKENKKLDKER